MTGLKEIPINVLLKKHVFDWLLSLSDEELNVVKVFVLGYGQCKVMRVEDKQDSLLMKKDTKREDVVGYLSKDNEGIITGVLFDSGRKAHPYHGTKVWMMKEGTLFYPNNVYEVNVGKGNETRIEGVGYNDKGVLVYRDYGLDILEKGVVGMCYNLEPSLPLVLRVGSVVELMNGQVLRVTKITEEGDYWLKDVTQPLNDDSVKGVLLDRFGRAMMGDDVLGSGFDLRWVLK